MKLLIDVSLSPLWALYLIEHGFDAVHWSDVGPRDAPDRHIFGWAATNGFAIITHDLDFGTMHALMGTRIPRVIQVRCPEVLPRVIGLTVLAAIRESVGDLETSALVTVEPFKHRVRVLPIKR